MEIPWSDLVSRMLHLLAFLGLISRPFCLLQSPRGDRPHAFGLAELTGSHY